MLAISVSGAVIGWGVHDERGALAQRARMSERMAEVVEQLTPIARTAASGQRVVLNGAPVYVRASGALGPVQAALEGVRDDCSSGDAARMLGVPDLAAEARAGIALAGVDMQRADGVSAGATLCRFRAPDHSLRVRYVFAQSTGGDASSLFSVTTLSPTVLEDLFPANGDAPGGDLPGMPRPPGSRRLLAADVEGSGYAARIYETRESASGAIARYEEAMGTAGWSSSESVADVMRDEARAFVRGEDTLVASFRPAGDVTLVALAPLPRR